MSGMDSIIILVECFSRTTTAMSIVERVSGDRGWLISHESFLEEVYSTTPLKPISGIFDVRTPFRMDTEAAKAAAAAAGNQGGNSIGQFLT